MTGAQTKDDVRMSAKRDVGAFGEPSEEGTLGESEL